MSDEKTNLDMLHKTLGQFGMFQISNMVLLLITATFSGFMAGDYIFTAARLPHRCAIPECDGPMPTYHPDWILNAVPAAVSGGFDDCRRYHNVSRPPAEPSGEECPTDLFNSEIVGCDTFVYERTNSAVYDFGLECQEWLRALAGTFNSAGALVGLPFYGYMSDRWGRKTTILICCFNIGLIGLIRAFSVNYPMYVAFQFLQTMLGGGMYSAAYVLAAEMVGPENRVPISATFSSIFALGQVFLGLIASSVYEWRTLSMFLHTPIFLVVLVNYFILSESARWLLSRNKFDEARVVLKRTARMNRKELDEVLLNKMISAKSDDDILKSKNDETVLFLRVIRSPTLLRRCCTTPVWWMTTTFVYYGLSINSVSLAGNMYMNYVAAAAVEIPGYWTAVIILDRIGRKWTLFGGFLLCSCCCLAFAFTPDTLPGLSLALYLLGKFAIAAVFTSLYLFTSELYPTKHRHTLLGFSSTIGRIGSILSPLTPPLMDYWTGIPSVLFGGMALLSAVLVLTQPETRGLKLPDTIEEAELIGKNNTILS